MLKIAGTVALVEIPEIKKSFEPTAKKALDLFAAIKAVWLNDGTSIERQLPKRYRELTMVLKMAGFDFDIFTSPP